MLLLYIPKQIERDEGNEAKSGVGLKVSSYCLSAIDAYKTQNHKQNKHCMKIDENSKHYRTFLRRLLNNGS